MSKLGKLGTEVTEIMGNARRAGSPVPRALDSMEELTHPGAREIATLTVIARSQDWQFEPLMKALEIASKITDWSHPFMVAHNIKGDKFGPSFSWRDAPFRRYESFAHFYQCELEATWGKWEDLQRTWKRIVKGEISEDEGRHIVLHGHGGDRRSEKAKADQGGNDENVTTLKPNEKNTKAHILARLDRDRPDLAARVRAGTMTANAAAIEAGFRKPSKRKKLSRVDRFEKAMSKWTKAERRSLWLKLEAEFGRRK